MKTERENASFRLHLPVGCSRQTAVRKTAAFCVFVVRAYEEVDFSAKQMAKPEQ
jgi:hypothetical protein